MPNLIIGVSGCSGGEKGPAGLYKFLAKNSGSDCKFFALPTLPEDLLGNIEKVEQVVASQLHKQYADVYLMGYSMGGAVAAIACEKIEKKNPGSIKGVILLSSQTEGLQVLKSLNVPLLMIHGGQDEYFPAGTLQRIFTELPQKKEWMLIEQGTHNLMPHAKISLDNTSNLAQNISKQIKSFFGFDLLRVHNGSAQTRGSWLASFFK